MSFCPKDYSLTEAGVAHMLQPRTLGFFLLAVLFGWFVLAVIDIMMYGRQWSWLFAGRPLMLPDT